MIENILAIFFVSGLAACVLIVIWGIILIIKSIIDCRNRGIIIDAICKYHIHLIKEGHYDRGAYLVKYEDMESFNATNNRFWDWGYTRILPPEKFELIKPYIVKESENDNTHTEP